MLHKNEIKKNFSILLILIFSTSPYFILFRLDFLIELESISMIIITLNFVAEVKSPFNPLYLNCFCFYFERYSSTALFVFSFIIFSFFFNGLVTSYCNFFFKKRKKQDEHELDLKKDIFFITQEIKSIYIYLLQVSDRAIEPMRHSLQRPATEQSATTSYCNFFFLFLIFFL